LKCPVEVAVEIGELRSETSLVTAKYGLNRVV